MKTYTEEQVKQMLRDRLVYPMTQKSLAAEIGVSGSHLNQVLRGCKPITGKYCNFLKLDLRANKSFVERLPF